MTARNVAMHTAEAGSAHPLYGAETRSRSRSAKRVDRMRSFVVDMLTLAQLELDGIDALTREPIDLNQLIGGIVPQMQTQAASAGLALTFLPTRDLPCVEGDGLLLTQMLRHLLVNALQHTHTGWVKIITSHAPTTGIVIVDVIDSGDGINAGELPYIFNRFYRTEAAQAGGIPGAGLGLAVVKEIDECHQGTISVDSTPGLGSRFSVQLPRTG